MSTIVDVARAARVSTSTVSHVVNGTRPVSDETRRRVLDAIEATGYRRDGVARALRRARTDSVGLVVSDVAQPAFAEMVRGVEAAATAAGYTLLLTNSHEDPALETRGLNALAAERVDGVIIAPVAGSDDKELAAIQESGTALVLLDRFRDIGADQVAVESAGPVRELTRHLITHGHQRIALAGGDLRVTTQAERVRGYREALWDAGIDLNPNYLVTSSGRPDETTGFMREVFSLQKQPTAVIAASTVTAVGVLEAARSLDLRIPTDLAFGTFDGFPHSDLFRPTITTILSPAHDIGRTAMELLLARLGGDRDTPRKTVRLEPKIIYRESCGCPYSSEHSTW